MTVFWLAVHKHNFSVGAGSALLFRKEVPTHGTPCAGDIIELGEDEATAYAKGRHWGHDGSLNVELQPIVWHPSARESARQITGDLFWPSPWRETDTETRDLFEMLKENGWRRR